MIETEHHDLMRVPWSRLPQVRRIAPEFYDSLVFHRSWTRLLFKFLSAVDIGAWRARDPRSKSGGILGMKK